MPKGDIEPWTRHSVEINLVASPAQVSTESFEILSGSFLDRIKTNVETGRFEGEKHCARKISVFRFVRLYQACANWVYAGGKTFAEAHRCLR